MQVKKLILRLSLFVAVIVLPLILLVTTNIGLNVALRAASWFSPLNVSYTKASGILISQPIYISGLIIKENHHALYVDNLEINWQSRTFSASKIQGFEYFLPSSNLLASGKNTAIDKISGQIDLHFNEQHLNIKLVGKWQQAPMLANLKATYRHKAWSLNSASLNIGPNSFNIDQLQDTSHNFKLDLVQPQIILKNGFGKLQASGHISRLGSMPAITATVTATHFGLQDYELKNFRLLASPQGIVANGDKLVINDQLLNKFKLNISGNFADHTIQSSLIYNTHPIRIDAHGEILGNKWITRDLQLNSLEENLRGSASYDLDKSKGQIDLQGNIYANATTLSLQTADNKNFKLSAVMRANQDNYLNAEIALKDNKLDGLVEIKAEDLSMIMKLMPDMTRLKGQLVGKAKISGSLDIPELKLEAHLTEITATFPGMGIKIKPMEIHLKGDESGKLILSGKGKMRRGTGEFVIKGYIEPFKDNMPNEINIIGTELEFINTENAHLTAANDLKFYYDRKHHRLDITGYVEIQKGNIYFDSKKSSTVKSKDVVFVDHKTDHKDELLVNPNINLRVLEEVHFRGFDLDADISGKLDIVQRNDALYATGRVTIKQGTYALPGQKLEINRGRLLYPPGTLLVNPTLDIKMHSSKKDDLEIVVQGTVQKPTIRESGLSENSDKAISQALATGSGMLSKKITGGKFRLPELGLTSRADHTVNFFDDRGKHRSSLAEKDLVVGMPLGKKLHVEYLQGLSSVNATDINKRVRLKYDFHENWAVGVESGDQGGGADLSFTFEKD